MLLASEQHCVNKLANMDLQSLFSDFAADLKWMNLTACSCSEHVVLLTASQHEQYMKRSQPTLHIQ